MSKAIDLTGKKFGRLTVTKQSEHKSKDLYWICKCECGNEKEIRGSHLRSKRIKSCGCLQKEQAAINNKNILPKTRKQNGTLAKETGQLMAAVNKDRYKGTKVGNLNSRLSSRNTSGYKGVCWIKNKNKYLASIFISGKKIFLGYFDDINEAIKARQTAEEKYFKPIIEEFKNK